MTGTPLTTPRITPMTTLLAHEWRRTRGMLGGITGIAVLLQILGVVMSLIPVEAIQTIGVLLMFFVAAGYLTVVLLALAVEYWRSAYGRQGYFTHTIPARGSAQYGVRLLYGAFVVVAALVVNALLLATPLVVAVSHEKPVGVGLFAYVVGLGREGLSALPAWAWLLIVAALVIASWMYLVQYYFAASIGSSGRLASLGVGGPILVWVVLYLVQQALTFVSIVAVPLGLDPRGQSLRLVSINYAAAIAGGGTDVIPFGFIPMLAVLTAVLIWWTARSWNRVSLR